MNSRNIMQISKSSEIVITGLSPIFIGSGEKYSQLDYINKNNRIYILDFDKILEQIPAESINDLTKEILVNFKNNIWKGDIDKFLNKYNIDWNKFIEKEYDLIGKMGKNEINQFIKTGDRIYIPGSSIKGAIRTAVLFDILKRNPDIKNRILPYVLTDFRDQEIVKLIQSDGRTALLRALMISDSFLENKNNYIKVIQTNVYHLRDKEFTIPIFYEVLDKGFESKNSIKINYKLLDSNTLITQYFNLTKNEILRAINVFSREIIDYELKVFENQNDPNLSEVINFYKDLKSQLDSLKKNECILRLGQGSSAIGISLFLNFQDNIQVVRKYKGLEIFTFNIPDRDNRSLGIARQGGFTILTDRESPQRPRLNETWLCSVVSTIKRTRIKYVSLIEKISSKKDIDQDSQRSFLYPLTRKFLVSQLDDGTKKNIYPFGWVKLKWE